MDLAMETDAVDPVYQEQSIAQQASSQPTHVLQQPQLDLEKQPALITRRSPSTGTRPGNFWRSARWAPDGSCILAHEDDRLAKIFTLPPELLDVGMPNTLQDHLSMPATPAALLGLEWFPSASLHRPEAFCFARSVRDLPVQLIDGNTGKVRASYCIIDHQERFVGPNSMTFSPDGKRLYCGIENSIESFDVANPGTTGTRHKLTPSKKAKQGQKGLISALALNPDGSGVLAAGSYSKSLCLYDASGGEPRLIRSLKSKDPAHRGAGVTQVTFHPTMPAYIYSTSRRMNHILVWDIRNPSAILMALPRPGNTHQRIHFDIDPWGKWLTTGDTYGNVHFFDTEDPHSEAPAASFNLANDTISSACLHPLMPKLLTTAGSRSYSPRRAASESSPSQSGSSSETSSEDSEDLEGEDSTASSTGETPDVSIEGRKDSSFMSLWSMQ